MLTYAFNIIDFIFYSRMGFYFILICAPFQACTLLWCATHFKSKR